MIGMGYGRFAFTGVLPQALMELDERTLARLDRDLGRLIDVLGADGKAGSIPLRRPITLAIWSARCFWRGCSLGPPPD